MPIYWSRVISISVNGIGGAPQSLPPQSIKLRALGAPIRSFKQRRQKHYFPQLGISLEVFSSVVTFLQIQLLFSKSIRNTHHTIFNMSTSAVLQAWEQCNLTDTVFVLVCTVFCWPIIPAVGLAYSGYSHRRNGMASFIPGVLSIGVCSIQWFIIGYSLAYGEGSAIIGDFKYAFHRGVLADPVGTIPAILFSEFQLIFCATVCAIAVGGACERGRTLPLIPFIFVSLKILARGWKNA